MHSCSKTCNTWTLLLSSKLKIGISLLKNIPPWLKFTPEKYSAMKNIHPWNMSTLEKYSPLKHVHPRKIFTTEKYSPNKNIHPWKILHLRNIHNLTITFSLYSITISPSKSCHRHLAVTISPSPSRHHPLTISPSPPRCHHMSSPSHLHSNTTKFYMPKDQNVA